VGKYMMIMNQSDNFWADFLFARKLLSKICNVVRIFVKSEQCFLITRILQ